MNRTSISSGIKFKLFADSCGKCANYKCKKNIFLNDLKRNVDFAHIVPHAKTQDNSYENLILICPNCHREVDKKEDREEILRAWKQNQIDTLEKLHRTKLDNFEELKEIVQPFLVCNRLLYKNYYLENKPTLWKKSEPFILANNNNLCILFENNSHLLKESKEQVLKFTLHAHEFKNTRADKNKIRGFLFPEEILQIFEIEPI